MHPLVEAALLSSLLFCCALSLPPSAPDDHCWAETARLVSEPVPDRLACFAGLDTTEAMHNGRRTTGCGGELYKQVSGRYVLRLKPNVPEQYDSCITIQITPRNGKGLTELLVFDKGQAHLRNLCSDVLVRNLAKPRKHLTAQRGTMIVVFNRPCLYYGSKTYEMSVLVKRLEFVDAQTGERIVLENQLFWRVVNITELG